MLVDAGGARRFDLPNRARPVRDLHRVPQSGADRKDPPKRLTRSAMVG